MSKTGRAPARLSAVPWPALIVLALFAATALVVPVMTPVSTTDDWGYTRSVEILRQTGDLTVFPVVAATAVYPIGWGALFSLMLGMSLGAMRISTIAMSLIGAGALYWLLRMLGARRNLAALGTASYLFNPLSFALSYTFMTDPHFTALMVLATACSIRGIADDERAGRFLLAGSAAASCAFLTRQQGVLIVIAIVVCLIVTGRIRVNRGGAILLLRVVAIPLVAMATYYFWLWRYNDVPDVQRGFLDEVRAAGVPGTWRLLHHLTFIEIMYVGFFCLPIVLVVIPFAARLRFRLRLWGWSLLAALLVAFAIEFARFAGADRHMPYVPQFIGPGGLGPADVRGSRARIIEQPWFDVASVVCAVSVVIVVIVVGRAALQTVRTKGAQAGLVATIMLFQVAGILPPSFHYLRRGYSLDRYLLPLLPLAVALLIWSLGDLRIVHWLGWTAIALFAVVSVALTRDYLVFLDTVWTAADQTVAAGAREDQVEAGSAWDGYHLYTDGLDQGITRARTRGGPWWTYFYGKATDSTYIISSKPQRGYVQQAVYTFETWLPRETRRVYVLRRKESAPPSHPFDPSKFRRRW